jgi:hypothetical protein
MALSLGFGILFATVITLALVPCFYLVVEDVRIRLGGRTTAGIHADAESSLECP